MPIQEKIPPVLDYSGLTIILDKPSRHDKNFLFSGIAGDYFKTALLPLSLERTEIRLKSCNDPFLPDTKLILALGSDCLKLLNINDLSLNEARGNIFNLNRDPEFSVPLIPTYAPQDAYDRKNFEKDSDEEEEKENEDPKGHGSTKRRNWRWWLLHDVKKAVRLLKEINNGGTIKSSFSSFKTRLYPNPKDIFNVLSNTKEETLFLDIETSARQILTCVGFNFSNSNEVFVFPWKLYNNTFAYDHRICREFIRHLAIAMGRNTVVCHNASFDLLVLAWKYKIPFPRKIFDTMLAWHRCHPEIEKSLGHLISYFLTEPYHKSEGVYTPLTPTQDENLWKYNAKDIITTRLVYYTLQKEIEKLKVSTSVARANSFVRPYLTMTMMGMNIDLEKFKNRFEELDYKRNILDRCIQNVVGIEDFNPRSHVQVSKYLYFTKKLPCLDENQPTNEKTLLRLLLKYPNLQSVPMILGSRKIGKTASSMKYRLWPDYKTGEYNKLTTAYNIAGTETFRLASRAVFKYKRGGDEAKKGYGTNVQNQDKAQRDLVIAPPGKKLGQIDQAGAEALIVAYLCRHGRFRELFLNNIKSHVYVALHVFKQHWEKRFHNPKAIFELCHLEPAKMVQHSCWKEINSLIKSSDDWEAKERFYFIAKMICHASNYGMKAPTFQLNVLEKSEGAVVLTLKQCREFLTLYHQLFPEIQEWHFDVRKQLQETRCLYNLFGERRDFTEFFGDSLWKEGYAFIPQSTIGEITNIAIESIQSRIEFAGDILNSFSLGLDLLQNGHDSVMFQFIDTPENDQIIINHLPPHLKPQLTSPRGEKFNMKCELQFGYNWGPFKKDKNPQGMKEIEL